jgi:hypothetical protein
VGSRNTNPSTMKVWICGGRLIISYPFWIVSCPIYDLIEEMLFIQDHMKIIEDDGPGAAFYASAKAMTNGNHTFYVSKLIQRLARLSKYDTMYHLHR